LAPRYAIYGLPPAGSPLANFGAAWLGRDVATGEAVARRAVPGISPDRQEAVTDSPRRYGFHATLKPPFALADGASVEELEEALAGLARTLAPFDAPPLRLADLDGFLALVLSGPCPAMDRLAECCVEALDAFRAPPGAAELKRRRAAGLTPRQDELLERWGYPYVMEAFRFHMTLTERIDGLEREAVMAALEPVVRPFCDRPYRVDEVCLLRETEPGAGFAAMRRVALAG